MKVRELRFDDAEAPASATVELSLLEMKFLAKMLGKVRSTEAGEVVPGGDEACSGIYRGLSGMVFNPYYENGVDDA